MIRGSSFVLRTLNESDLPEYQSYMADIANRGDYFPHFIQSETDIRNHFHEDGFWTPDRGLLLIVNDEGKMIGLIQFFKPVPYWNAYEIAYLMFDATQRGKGIMTDATHLLVRYLFDNKLINRLQLGIHPENRASQRVAEKCGFTLEGTMRGCWFQSGKHNDMRMYSILREEVTT
jgi:RimJ/RimL family protein N-acetyltransferase